MIPTPARNVRNVPKFSRAKRIGPSEDRTRVTGFRVLGDTTTLWNRWLREQTKFHDFIKLNQEFFVQIICIFVGKLLYKKPILFAF